MQRDPIGYFDSMNLYQYVGNNSTNWNDPSGLLYNPYIPFLPSFPQFHWDIHNMMCKGLLAGGDSTNISIWEDPLSLAIGAAGAALIGGAGLLAAATIGLEDLLANGIPWPKLNNKGMVWVGQTAKRNSEEIAKGARIDKLKELIKNFGGLGKYWKKMKGWGRNGKEIHWYEYKGKTYLPKTKGQPDPPMGNE